MDTQAELNRIQSLLLNLISATLSNRDVTTLSALSGFIKEYETLVEAAKSTLNDSRPASTISRKPTYSVEAPTISRKAAAAQARIDWVAGLQEKGISLRGHGTRYQTARGQSVAMAFANELDNPDRWFLGLPDEPTDVAAFLCKSHDGKLYDIVLPATLLREVWPSLSKSQSGVKFNIRKERGQFLLLLTGDKPRDVSKYVGNYEPLR